LLKVSCWLDSITPNSAKNGLKYWCQDETRIGWKTIERKKITAFGVKPIGKLQGNFKAYYLYGAVAPQTGETLIVGVFTLRQPMFSNFFSSSKPLNIQII
jgi:hypothetical protein